MDSTYIDLEGMGKRIREIRKSQRKTQEVFAEMIHISTSYLALIEQGKRSASLDIIAQISNICHVSVDYLMFGKEAAQTGKNQEIFNDLCRRYPARAIERALRLSSYYLAMQDEIGTGKNTV